MQHNIKKNTKTKKYKKIIKIMIIIKIKIKIIKFFIFKTNLKIKKLRKLFKLFMIGFHYAKRDLKLNNDNCCQKEMLLIKLKFLLKLLINI